MAEERTKITDLDFASSISSPDNSYIWGVIPDSTSNTGKKSVRFAISLLQGANGTNGTNGVGVPSGGTTGQVLAKNSSTDYDTGWITQSGGTPTPVNLSSATSDYSLAVGETAYVNYSNATSVLLHIASVEGLYELDLVGPVNSAQSDIGNMLLPNNASGTAGAFKLVGTRIADTGSVAAYSSLTAMTAFNIGPARMVRSVVHISTQTTSKSVNFSSIIIRTGYTIEQISASSYWTDTTTAWTSLGTVTFNTAQSGKIVVRRIL